VSCPAARGAGKRLLAAARRGCPAARVLTGGCWRSGGVGLGGHLYVFDDVIPDNYLVDDVELGDIFRRDVNENQLSGCTLLGHCHLPCFAGGFNDRKSLHANIERRAPVCEPWCSS
jgi:hypothetical protein